MIRMDMVWVAVATLIQSAKRTDVTVTKQQIDSKVKELFGTHITPVMISRHLVNSIDRQAAKDKPQRGGSRKRYLFKDQRGGFRLYKSSDYGSDGWDKTGPTHPEVNKVDVKYRSLVTWYCDNYY